MKESLARIGEAKANSADSIIRATFFVPSHFRISKEALSDSRAISIGNAQVSEKISIGMNSDIITTPVIILVFILPPVRRRRSAFFF
jgi:hypothetical protein